MVGNKFISPDQTQEPIEVRSPYTNTLIGRLFDTSEADLAQATKIAQEAFERWRKVPLKERANLFLQFRSIVLGKLDSLSCTAALEAGKTFEEAKAGILKGIEVVEFAISLQNAVPGQVQDVSRGVTCSITREPLGVVAAINPFNFPAMVPMWTYPIAIMMGNTFIMKPSEKVPLTSQLFGEIFLEAGFPSGVFSIINGGVATVDRILRNEVIQAVSFVGSTPVAKKVYSEACRSGKRALALGGAKNFLIVAPDADRELTTSGVVSSFTGCAGQRCMAGSVLIAVGSCEPLLENICERAKKLKLGPEMGAIITKESRDRIKSAIDQMEKRGAKIRVDGRNPTPPKDYPNGNWLGPTIIDGLKPEDESIATEIFGPVLTIVRVPTLADAMAIENKHLYGNATSIFTTSGAAARYVSEKATNGMIGINIGVPVPREPFSFGGRKQSKFGAGDITGYSSLDFWTDQKKITMKWSEESDKNWMS